MSLTAKQSTDIIRNGAYYLIDDYADRADIQNKIKQAFLNGVEHLAGTDCRANVERDGLGQLHRHFPISKIHRLEDYLMAQLQEDLYYWSYRVGEETLGIREPFYIDHLIVFRIHYPFLLARAAKNIEPAPFAWKERFRLAGAAMRNWDVLSHYFRKRRQVKEARANGTLRHDPFSYHGQIPVAARSHGPHIDTWYGHSYDGVNFWLSVEGVNEDNTVILYPDMFGRAMEFDPVTMYVAPGLPLCPPVKIVPAPGQLLAFNPEVLHSTQVNISDETRVALTTRINPAEPRFNPDAPFNMEHWYSSTDVSRRRFSSVKVFPARRHAGKPSMTQRPAYRDATTRRVVVEGTLDPGHARTVCKANELKHGEMLAVDFDNAKVFLIRSGNEVRAFSRKCPHVGVDVADGSHDGTQVYCPGHGIAYSLADGRSKCSAFQLKPFRACETGGQIEIEREETNAPKVQAVADGVV